VIGPSADPSLALVVIMLFGSVILMLIQQQSTEKRKRSCVPAADERNVGSAYEMPTVSATVSSPT